MKTVDATHQAGQSDFAEKLLKHTTISVSDAYLDAFRNHVEVIHYDIGSVLFRTGDDSSFAILIAEGEVEVYNEQTGHVLAVAGDGSLIGELGLISGDPRSASARALTPVRGWKIDRSQYREFLSDRPEVATLFFRKIYAQLSASYGKLRQQFVALEEADRRYHALAFLFVTMVLMINIYALVNSIILTHLKVSHQEQVMFWTSRVMEVWGAFVIWGLTVRCGLTRQDMGIRMENLWKSIGVGLGISVVALAAMAYFRTILYPELQGTPIIDPKLVTITVYTYILVAPLQEWICRGVLLTAIADLMPGKTRPMSAIVITSLIFSTLHLHYSQSLAVVALVSGIVWGWLHLKYRNLAGPIVSHFILGNAATLMGVWSIWERG
ncbi:cyclic nucleotide-binding domain-containing protein [Rhizobium sp. AQ_MP]|uniref:cyclic nucleotide-binding domain-containing protein n=1 Tax=Rhizobium sp. AQ_MP TaxID=2761536 RepID=UPI00163B2F43|nr:cyclic nucleotide-binding domain-containing protein [Rhizobium sp. AQ_MP]MBC2773523.1 cyclic nucleotide-binding domain-containing protein [Rhizobium sp. AQ_MP]